MDKFLEMQSFAAVVDAGSFVKAASALGMSKAAVSRYVGDLEARLGARLLHRTTRRLALTEEGEVFHARCKELLSFIDEAEAEVSAGNTDPSGRVRVSAPVTFGIHYLAPLWGKFRALHPKITLDVTLSDRVVDLIEEGFDLGIRIGVLSNSMLVSRCLSTTRMVMCASPQYLAARGRPRHPAELLDHSIIGYNYWSTGNEWHFDGPQGKVSVRITPCFQTNSGDTNLAAVLSHQGVTLQPSFLVAEHLRAGRLVELMPEFRSAELGIYAVYPTRKHVPAKIRLLIDWLADSFRTTSWSDQRT
ncbi:LysR family transcriptional regulator [Duganella radicis]|uniref:LysR family transcriptional regulator n=1 Tax=Duganella radicis TaxID=551988 RepID=A0A6L6PE62_9BURK|nr:LysR family transcriptional regulator [Duganella radicis]MTV37203.1 LysR family transcriptional regulator [Duganella radicis]